MADNAFPKVETEYEVWQDGMSVAASTSIKEAQHYLAMYQQDGPAILVECIHVRRALEGQKDG